MLDRYRFKDCMVRFCKDFKKYATKISYYEQKEIILLRDEENRTYKNQKYCYICKKVCYTYKNDKNVFKLYHKVRDRSHYTGKHKGFASNICNLRNKFLRLQILPANPLYFPV